MEFLRQTSFNLNKYCRTCFIECENEGYNVETFPEALFRLFKQCVPYERTQKNVTNLLCPLCYDTLRNFEEFRSKALARTYLLERFLKLQKLANDTKKAITNTTQHKLSNKETVLAISSKTVCSAAEGNSVSKCDQYEQEMHLEVLETDSDEHEINSMMSRRSISSDINDEIGSKNHDIDPSDQDFEEILRNTVAETEENNDESLECLTSKSIVSKGVKSKNATETKISEKNYFPENVYFCSHCDRTFQYTMILSKHLTEAHHLKPTFTACPHKGCNRMFKHKETTMQHYKLEHGLETLQDCTSTCDRCGKTFANKQKLKRHHYTAHGLDTGTEVCDDEHPYSRINKSNGNKRVKINSKAKELNKETLIYSKKSLPKHRSYSCSYCDRSYYYAMTLSKHLTAVHNLESNFTVCPHENCNETFEHDETAKQHYRHNHQLEVAKDTSCICELCGQTFENEQKLKNHHYKHKPDARPFHCEICDKRFVSKSSYKGHKLRHAGIKEYECPHCNAKKTTHSELRAHLNVHSIENQYPCPSCPRVFRWASAFYLHNRIVHKGIRRNICRFCGKPFGKPENLKYHERRHTGERPYECKVCDKKFISPSCVISHNKTKLHKENVKANNLTKVTHDSTGEKE